MTMTGRNILLGGMMILLIGGSMSCAPPASSAGNQPRDKEAGFVFVDPVTEGLSIVACRAVPLDVQPRDDDILLHGYVQALKRECRTNDVQVVFGSVGGMAGAWLIDAKAVAVDQNWLSKQTITSNEAGEILKNASPDFLPYWPPSPQTFLVESSTGTLAVFQILSYSESTQKVQVYCHPLKRI